MRLEYVDNCQAWGDITCVSWGDSDNTLLSNGRHYRRPYPGMLVTNYDGCSHRRMKERFGHDRHGLGIVLSVEKHPDPLGDVRFLCLVLWNW